MRSDRVIRDKQRSPLGYDGYHEENGVMGWKAVGNLKENGVSMRGNGCGGDIREREPSPLGLEEVTKHTQHSVMEGTDPGG